MATSWSFDTAASPQNSPRSVLHEWEVPPDKGKDTGGELHRQEGGKKVNKKLFKNGKTIQGRRSAATLFRWSLLSRCCTGEPGTRRRRTSLKHFIRIQRSLETCTRTTRTIRFHTEAGKHRALKGETKLEN